MSKSAHFGALLEQFSEGEVDSEEEGDDDDVPLAIHAWRRKAEADICHTEEDSVGDGDGGGEQQQQQQQEHATTSRDEQECTAATHRWTYTHCTMYAPFVYAPNIITPSHPFGIYAPNNAQDCGTLKKIAQPRI
jgi:hypothetical protein